MRRERPGPAGLLLLPSGPGCLAGVCCAATHGSSAGDNTWMGPYKAQRKKKERGASVLGATTGKKEGSHDEKEGGEEDEAE